MKKGILLLALSALFLINFVSAACTLTSSLINQDPYPAVPGDYVKLVFQVAGVTPTCGDVTFRLVPKYPISFDPGVSSDVSVLGGTYVKDYGSHILIPYQVRLDTEALDGEVSVEFWYTTSNFSEYYTSSEFNITVEDVRSNFEVYVKDYNTATGIITFEVLNIGGVDVEALTIEVPKQSGIEIKGANREIMGDLDSNEYTTADFEAVAQAGEINVRLIYTDSVDVRREVNKTISFDPTYFDGLSRSKVVVPWWLYVLILGAVGFFAWRLYRRHKKKKLHHQLELHKK